MIAAALALAGLVDSAHFHADKIGAVGSISFTGQILPQNTAELIVEDGARFATYCLDGKCRRLTGNEPGVAVLEIGPPAPERLAFR